MHRNGFFWVMELGLGVLIILSAFTSTMSIVDYTHRIAYQQCLDLAILWGNGVEIDTFVKNELPQLHLQFSEYPIPEEKGVSCTGKRIRNGEWEVIYILIQS